jgi:omega-6 fatty acid desaturase (delta-12 desaturase)
MPGSPPALSRTPPERHAARAAGSSPSRARHSLPGAFRREDLDAYAQPRVARSLLDLATAVIPYLGLSVAMYFSLRVSYLLVLLLAIPASGFLVRTFILFHDCSHGSLLPWRKANVWLGAFLGLFVYSPFLRWRHDHAIHHATSGDLERRGGGDVRTLTVAEYNALAPRAQLGYRLFRTLSPRTRARACAAA